MKEPKILTVVDGHSFRVCFLSLARLIVGSKFLAASDGIHSLHFAVSDTKVVSIFFHESNFGDDSGRHIERQLKGETVTNVTKSNGNWNIEFSDAGLVFEISELTLLNYEN